MSASLAVWSVRVEPGTKAIVVPQADIRITGAALDATLADGKARSSVKFTYVTPQAVDEDDEGEPLPPTTSTILCSLTPGHIEQATLDLIVNEEDELEFEIVGKNPVYLTGNYITQPTDFPVDEDESDSDEEAYDLRDISSDVEIDPSEIDDLEDENEEDDSHRFEEIKDDDEEMKDESPAAPASKKRPRESDAVESTTDGEAKLSKKQQKKLNKKLKTDDGKAVSNGDVKPEESGKKSAKKEDQVKEEKKSEKKEKKKDKKEGEKEESKKAGELKETSSGLKIKDHKTGSGKTAKKGDKVSMRYIGRFMDGKVFDSNTQKGKKPFEFVLGAGEVIKGWDEGIAGMQAGGERLLIVPPKLGYGSRKLDGIPANSTLKFECKLLEIK